MATKNLDQDAPLEEIAEAPAKEIVELSPELSLPEILIVGSKPLHSNPRCEHETRILNEAIVQRVSILEDELEKRILPKIRGVFPEMVVGETAKADNVLNYLEKYEFLLRVLPEELEAKLPSGIREQIRKYRETIPIYRSRNKREPPNVRELKRLANALTDIVYYTLRTAGDDPFLVGVKYKVPERVGAKIAYQMLEGYRHRKGKKQGNGFKRYLRSREGVIRDYRGIQVVTLGREGLGRVKESATTSLQLEIVPDHKGRLIDNHYAETENPYHAFHMDVVWNPKQRKEATESKMFDPHVDAVELQITEAPYRYTSEFGVEGYFRRMEAEKKGILLNRLNRRGVLDFEPFTPQELEWKKEVERRVVQLMTYHMQKQRN